MSTSNRNSFNRLSLNITPSSIAHLQPQQQQQFQQQQMYNTIHSPQQPPPPVYQPPQPSWWNTGLAGIGGGRRNSYVTNNVNQNQNNYYYNDDIEDQQQQSIPSIQIDQPNSPTQQQQQQQQYCSSSPRPRANSSITAARNKLRIMAMLDDVRKKRELRDRRKSDIMTYLDDLIVPDDPTMANGAPGTLKLYRRRFLIYQFLNHPSTSTPWSITYHVMVFVIVFVCLILTICATIQQAPLQEKAIKSVYMLEKVVVVWFNIEFCLGLWSCACKKRYRGLMGKVRYLTIPSRLIDFVILSFTTIVLVFNPSKTGHEVFVVSAFRGFHRFFQVAQVLTLNRPLKPWKVLASVIYDQREQLFIIYYTEFIVLCVLAYVAFLVERDTNDNFNSIADAMWWAIVTLSTVGYGDRVPVTWVGKIISTMFTILGVAIFALPAGIIGTGLALKIEEVERNNIRNRKKVAAALLIQRAYRSWKAHRTYELVSKFFRERPMPIYKQHDYLSMAQKFIALVQFLAALNKFRELLRPVDWKTVMQSYSDGQTEVLLRTKLVQQSIEELSRRIEMTENRVANMSMKIETKQNTFERRIDHIRQLMESCHRQLLANHLLVELLRTTNSNNQRNQNLNPNNSTIMTQGRKHTSSIALSRQVNPQQPPAATKQSMFANQTTQNRSKTPTATTKLLKNPSLIDNSNELKLSTSNPPLIANMMKQQTSTTMITRPNHLNLKKSKYLYPIASSGSNTSIDDVDDQDDDYDDDDDNIHIVDVDDDDDFFQSPNINNRSSINSNPVQPPPLSSTTSSITTTTTTTVSSSSAGPIISVPSPSTTFPLQQQQQQENRQSNNQQQQQTMSSNQQQQQQQNQQSSNHSGGHHHHHPHNQYRSRRMSL
uniref:Uncharacterized protein LOC113791163 n=1 Tax=Dermatophagoides pteronyssinus TaxID=6956 RepID=A0A6P6XTQ2_DERPT|nr:uncharacterized protein LOC113791163 [Dermatophagoides pteronyssinus]